MLKLMRVAIVVKRLALDVLHDEVGQAVFRRSTIQKPGDVGMIQGGQDLAFGAEATEDEVRVHAALDELDCRALVEFVVDANCFVDGAHAAAANLAFDPVGAQAAADHRILIVDVIDERSKRTQRAQFSFTVQRLFQKISGTLVLRQQRLDVAL